MEEGKDIEVEKAEELAWARRPRELVPLMEKKAEEYERQGFTQKSTFMLGFALDVITGDDANIFLPFVFDPTLNTTEARQRAKLKLLERLRWEEEYEYLPEGIRERVRETREETEKLNWSNQEEFDKGKKTWYEKVHDWVNAKMKEDAKLYEAMINFKELHYGVKLR